jgi:hypothetical protein
MNMQSEQTKNAGTRPNKHAIAALMAGVFLICPVSGWILLVSVYGLFWDQIMVISLSASLVGLALGYGTIKIIRGNEITKQLAKTTLKNFGAGAAIASIVGLVLVIIKTVSAAALGEYYYWTDESFLIIVMSRVLITGIPAGGIGGAILGSTWKHKLAAIIGGIVGEILITPVLLMMFSTR